ncbi:unnamed protein product [Rotaria sp. Silwood1]|nr:unnamed protein product [Rotaria sp. Silwood1]CAF1642613.1 unnamed protein product [Rotaria sp. Silwood1]CAF3748138.1 unnamed protein product [Rotaria sp. Silwood1]CAF3781205.1 unnamed protein product [Rotaria sp. Silwood1]CAF3810664.1 unnamed protein product [Rotaria sp. Silwood1]
MEFKKSVIIIGGGWSGIGVAGSFAYNNFDDYILLEQTDCIGGFWKYHTYDSVRMHDLSRLYKTPHHLLEKYKDHFLLQSEVPMYLQQYAEHYGISNRVIFRFKVTQISNQEDEEFCWRVTGINLIEDVERTYICKYLCIATSYCRVPHIPENIMKSMDRFKRKIIHSADYKNPSTFDISKHRKILIIGGGHSSAEISTELTDAGFHVTIAHRGGQYFMRQHDWTPYLSNQTIEKSLQYWGYSMADENFKKILDTFDERFLEKIYYINNDINWAIPLLRPASFIILHKKTFIDDAHFIDLLRQKSIEVKGTVREIVEEGVIFENRSEIQEFDGIILCTGFSHGLEQFLDNANQYLSHHRYRHLPPEKACLPITDGRCKSFTKKQPIFSRV